VETRLEVAFPIENVSGELLTLQREIAFVQDIILISYVVDWIGSERSGGDFRKVEPAPGESSTIEWVIGDLEDAHYASRGRWWSAGMGEMDTILGIHCGSVYC